MQIQEYVSMSVSWGDVVLLLIGAILGAVMGTYYAARTRQPRLVRAGGSGGGNRDVQNWKVAIANQPVLLGKPTEGEPARDVYASLVTWGVPKKTYPLYWNSDVNRLTVTIEPAGGKELRLFQWQRGTPGYAVLNAEGIPIARFTDGRRKFTIVLTDKLRRTSRVNFWVDYDETHLVDPPNLRLVFPISLRERPHRVWLGMRQIFSAFRPSGNFPRY